MRTTKGILLSLMAVALFFTPAFGAGDAEKGKALFNDPHFADGKAGSPAIPAIRTEKRPQKAPIRIRRS